MLLLLLPLRWLMGLRSAEGERGPRCLHPPSPPLRTGNNLGFSSLPPFFLIALTPSMRKVPPPRPHPHKLNKPAGFGSPPAATPPLLPLLSCALCPLYTATLYFIYVPPSSRPHLSVFALFSDFIQVWPAARMCYFMSKLKHKHHSIPAPHGYRGAR